MNSSATPTPESGNGGDTVRRRVLDALGNALPTAPVGLVIIELRLERELGGHIDLDGDVLAELQNRIARCLADTDELLTANVDRFVIIKRKLSAPAETEGFALRLLNALGGPVLDGSTKGVCHATIGVAVSHATDTAEDLLRYAEHALADAHVLGGDLVVCFEDADRELLA